jgi:hypothetical protein
MSLLDRQQIRESVERRSDERRKVERDFAKLWGGILGPNIFSKNFQNLFS